MVTQAQDPVEDDFDEGDEVAAFLQGQQTPTPTPPAEPEVQQEPDGVAEFLQRQQIEAAEAARAAAALADQERMEREQAERDAAALESQQDSGDVGPGGGELPPPPPPPKDEALEIEMDVPSDDDNVAGFLAKEQEVAVEAREILGGAEGVKSEGARLEVEGIYLEEKSEQFKKVQVPYGKRVDDYSIKAEKLAEDVASFNILTAALTRRAEEQAPLLANIQATAATLTSKSEDFVKRLTAHNELVERVNAADARGESIISVRGREALVAAGVALGEESTNLTQEIDAYNTLVAQYWSLPPEEVERIDALQASLDSRGDVLETERLRLKAISGELSPFLEAYGEEVSAFNLAVEQLELAQPTALESQFQAVNYAAQVRRSEKFEQENTQLATGEWISNEDFQELTPAQQDSINQLGIEAFKTSEASLVEEQTGEALEDYYAASPPAGTVGTPSDGKGLVAVPSPVSAEDTVIYEDRLSAAATGEEPTTVRIRRVIPGADLPGEAPTYPDVRSEAIARVGPSLALQEQRFLTAQKTDFKDFTKGVIEKWQGKVENNAWVGTSAEFEQFKREYEDAESKSWRGVTPEVVEFLQGRLDSLLSRQRPGTPVMDPELASEIAETRQALVRAKEINVQEPLFGRTDPESALMAFSAVTAFVTPVWVGRMLAKPFFVLGKSGSKLVAGARVGIAETPGFAAVPGRLATGPTLGEIAGVAGRAISLPPKAVAAFLSRPVGVSVEGRVAALVGAVKQEASAILRPALRAGQVETLAVDSMKTLAAQGVDSKLVQSLGGYIRETAAARPNIPINHLKEAASVYLKEGGALTFDEALYVVGQKNILQAAARQGVVRLKAQAIRGVEEEKLIQSQLGWIKGQKLQIGGRVWGPEDIANYETGLRSLVRVHPDLTLRQLKVTFQNLKNRTVLSYFSRPGYSPTSVLERVAAGDAVVSLGEVQVIPTGVRGVSATFPKTAISVPIPSPVTPSRTLPSPLIPTLPTITEDPEKERVLLPIIPTSPDKIEAMEVPLPVVKVIDRPVPKIAVPADFDLEPVTIPTPRTKLPITPTDFDLESVDLPGVVPIDVPRAVPVPVPIPAPAPAPVPIPVPVPVPVLVPVPIPVVPSVGGLEAPRAPGLVLPFLPDKEEEEEEVREGLGGIAGSVVNSLTNEPALGVDVTVDGRRTETSEDGKFYFEGLQPGLYKVSALGETRTARITAGRTSQVRFVIQAAGFLGELRENARIPLPTRRPIPERRTSSRRRRPVGPTIEGIV